MTGSAHASRSFIEPPQGFHIVYATLGRALALCGLFEKSVLQAAIKIGFDEIPRDGDLPDFGKFIEMSARVEGIRLAKQIQHYVAPEDVRPFTNSLLIEAKDQRNFLAHDIPKYICANENPEDSFESLTRLVVESARHVARGVSVADLSIQPESIEVYVDEAAEWVRSGPN